MLLRLQKFDLEVAYSEDTKMHIADPLSRAYLPSTNQDEEVKEDVWLNFRFQSADECFKVHF